MKKALAMMTAACFVVLFALQTRAISLDGAVTNLEWDKEQKLSLVALGSNSMCSISDATLYWSISAPGDSVTFGLVAHAPDSLPGSPVGAAIQAGGAQIAHWQNGGVSSASDALYSLRAAADFPDAAGSFFTLELELGCKTPAAFVALESLIIRLYDPQGVPSKEISLRIAPAEPVVTTTTTTEKPTTTKAPTTEKTTTSKTTTSKATTTKVTTTKATTATTATTPTTTTAAAVTTAAPMTFAASVPQTTLPSAAAAPKYSVATTWYTVVLSETTAEPPPLPLWTFAEQSEEAHSAPEPLAPAQDAPAPASRNSYFLYGMAVLLLPLAALLVIFFLKDRQSK